MRYIQLLNCIFELILMNEYFNKILDLLMFRTGVEEDEAGHLQPVVTTGSIVWGVLLRSFIIIFISFLFMALIENRKFWWLSFLILWLVAAYPGWKQYQAYKKRMEDFEESTLCGKCIHFDPTSQLCKLYDEHVYKDYVPCEGVDWEPKTIEKDE